MWLIKEATKLASAIIVFIGALHLVQCEYHAGELDFHLEREKADGKTEKVES